MHLLPRKKSLILLNHIHFLTDHFLNKHKTCRHKSNFKIINISSSSSYKLPTSKEILKNVSKTHWLHVCTSHFFLHAITKLHFSYCLLVTKTIRQFIEPIKFNNLSFPQKFVIMIIQSSSIKHLMRTPPQFS